MFKPKYFRNSAKNGNSAETGNPTETKESGDSEVYPLEIKPISTADITEEFENHIQLIVQDPSKITLGSLPFYVNHALLEILTMPKKYTPSALIKGEPGLLIRYLLFAMEHDIKI